MLVFLFALSALHKIISVLPVDLLINMYTEMNQNKGSKKTQYTRVGAYFIGTFIYKIRNEKQRLIMLVSQRKKRILLLIKRQNKHKIKLIYTITFEK